MILCVRSRQGSLILQHWFHCVLVLQYRNDCLEDFLRSLVQEILSLQYQLSDVITPRLHSILDTLSPNPAIIRNLSWDVLAWNDAAAAVLTDYALLAPENRNIMRLFFLKNEVRAHNPDWLDTANLIVSAFRADIARLGETERTEQLVIELSEHCDVFKTLWTSQKISRFNEGVKCLNKPDVGEISLAYSSFNVSSRPELSLIVYTPESEVSLAKLKKRIQNCKK